MSWDPDSQVAPWGGFVTKDLKPCRAIARLIAIVANWWNIFCRLADGDRHLEPTTSRPMYMGVVGRLVTSGRQRLLCLTSTHLKAREIQSSLMRIGEFMKRISATAERLDFNRIWELIILVAFRKWLRVRHRIRSFTRQRCDRGRRTDGRRRALEGPDSGRRVAGEVHLLTQEQDNLLRR